MSQAQARRFSRRVGQRFESLDALARAARIARELKLAPERFDQLRDEAIACLTLPDLKKTGRVIHRPPEVILTAFDSTMTRYALRFRDGTILVRRVADDGEIARFQARGDREIFVFGLSPDGRYMATTHFPGFALTVWDIDTGTVVVSDPGPLCWGAAKFSPDSRRIALARGDGQFIVYDLASGQPRRSWRGPTPLDPAFSPGGTEIAVLYKEPKSWTCQILEAESGRLVRSMSLPALDFMTLLWSPDGTTLATPCHDNKIYLWDAATGTRKAVLEGSTGGGLIAAFHPSGTLVGSNGWEAQLRLWDASLGRPVLSMTGESNTQFKFSKDGRTVVWLEDELTTYQVDPALEYRTFAHDFGELIADRIPSIRCDGRVLALGTERGVALWDLARGRELPFLPIGQSGSLFEASGDLLTLTAGSLGLQRWPVRLDPNRGEFRIGPPHQLPLPPGAKGFAEDRAGQIVAMAYRDHALVSTPERTIRLGPLDDCRTVAVSPDGQWLATRSYYFINGAQVWHIPDGARVADLKVEGRVGVAFSPDGKWLMTSAAPCQLWTVGTWKEAGQKIGGNGLCFSPDGHLLAVRDATKVIRLVETETGRTVARLESPDLCAVENATFSPDGSRLVVLTNDGPAVHIWDLRSIRRRLAEMGLDWEAPAYDEDDPADATLPPLPPLQVDLGPLAGEISNTSSNPPTP